MGLSYIDPWHTQFIFFRVTEMEVTILATLFVWARGFTGIMRDGVGIPRQRSRGGWYIRRSILLGLKLWRRKENLRNRSLMFASNDWLERPEHHSERLSRHKVGIAPAKISKPALRGRLFSMKRCPLFFTSGGRVIIVLATRKGFSFEMDSIWSFTDSVSTYARRSNGLRRSTI